MFLLFYLLLPIFIWIIAVTIVVKTPTEKLLEHNWPKEVVQRIKRNFNAKVH